MRGLVAAAGLWACLSAFSGNAGGDESGFEGSGSAPVVDDVMRARDRSLQEAMQRVLEQAVAQAAPEARGRLYLVSARAREYVTTYRMVEESATDGQFRVRIQAQVDLPRLLRDLQVPAGEGRPTPRSLILLCAEEPGDAEGLGALRSTLSAYGPTLPQGACPAGGQAANQEASQAASQAKKMATAMGAAGAQVGLLVRVASGAPAAEVRGTQPPLYGASATARVGLYRGAGSPLEESRESFGFAESAKDAEQAARRLAGQAALAALLPRLGAPGSTETTTGVAVSLDGVGSYGDYQRLLKVMAAMPGVTRVEPRSFIGGAQGMRVEVQLVTGSPANVLGASLGRTPIPGLRLQVMPEGSGKLQLLVAPEAALPGGGGAAPANLPTPPPRETP